ncbi:MAG: hypothetical protein ABIN69_08480 [Aestuariivirga sp.]
MIRILSKLFALGFAFCLFSSHALASGDVGCTSTMKVFFKSFTGCDSMAILSPGNDTRVNLVFLLADARGQKLPKTVSTPDGYPKPSLFTPADWAGFSASLVAPKSDDETSSGEGTVCVSFAKGSADFLAAVASDKDVTDADKATLKSAREAMICPTDASGSTTPVPALDVQSANAKDFAAYLVAVRNFYQASHFDGAGFAALINSSQPWVREASRYMQARVALLAAQAEAFSDYGTLEKEKINPAMVKTAKDALDAYLKDYPQGAYAISATGLLRRAAWLSNDGSAQQAAYAALLAKAEVNEESLALINELDLKLPANAYLTEGADPLFLAVEDLREMREQLGDDGKPKPGMKAEVIEAQKSRFAENEALYDYLLAVRAWFVDKDAQAVLKLLPEKPPAAELNYLEFSRQLLRAAALDETGNKADYVAMFPFAKQPFQDITLQLALAISDERNKTISAVFEPGSLITAPEIREQVLDYIAGPILLRQQTTNKDVSPAERDTALYRLFARDLVQGHFKGFLEDITLLPPKPEPDANGTVADKFGAFRWEGSKEGYICPDLLTTVKKLVTDAKDVQGRLCLGEFFLTTDIGDIGTLDKDALGGTGTLFAGAPSARHDFYTDIIKDPAAKRDDKAYALFRAVHCYEPVHINGCGGKDASLAVRKSWHDELKSKYATTPWAKELHYYW